MKDLKVNRLKKGLLTDKLSWEEKEKLSKQSSVEMRMKQQWESVAEEPCDPEMGERIWRRLEKSRKVERQRHQFSFHPYLVAASIILFVVGGGLWIMKQNWSAKPEYIHYMADRALMYLMPDSTKIWMQAGSKICYAKEFEDYREVWLDGEALFDVTKGRKNNFKVHLSKAFIEVKGTSFLVKKDVNDINEITLFEGKVEFNINNTDTKIAMNPMEKIIYDPRTVEVSLEKVENMNWDNGRYQFTDIMLEQLIEMINEKYDSHIVLGKNINKTHRYTGSISHGESLDKIIEKLCYTMGLKVEKHGEEILIH